MTDKEILAELKISYENLRDIRENGCIDHCNGQMKDNVDKLDKAINYIADIYYDFYKTLDRENLRVELLEKKVDGKVYIENDISGDYMIDTKMYEEECGGDLYMTCEDLEYYWYNDRKFLDK